MNGGGGGGGGTTFLSYSVKVCIQIVFKEIQKRNDLGLAKATFSDLVL